VTKEAPFGNLQALDPNKVTNYTLAIRYTASGLPGNPNSDVDLAIQQNAITNYHVKVNADGVPVEAWLVDGAAYLLQDSAVTTLPQGIDTQLFAPAVFLHSTPLPAGSDMARRIGPDSVSGRPATHYHLDAKDAARMAAGDDSFVDGITKETGGLDIWIDDELSIVSKVSGDVSWTNADGSPGAIHYDYLLSDVGSTQPIPAPAH
jgi:hypothetical protein